MKKCLIAIFIFLTTILIARFVFADQDLPQKLSGRILLQVESHGEAWYVSPSDFKRYYLGRPKDALELMQNLGIGITDENLAKIPVGIVDYDDQDDDNDGLTNRLEQALGADPQKQDTDGDGNNDRLEIENNYDPLSAGALPIDKNFAQQHAGKIFLQTEHLGEAWYVNPADEKRYYLGRPSDAFTIMKKLSLGITNANLSQITTGYLTGPPTPPTLPPLPPTCTNCQTSSAGKAISGAASAIRSGNTSKAVSYFIPAMQKAIEYTMNFLDAEGRLILGNIISGTSLSKSNIDEKIYSTEVYFSLGGYKVPINFHVKKQEDGAWLLTNL